MENQVNVMPRIGEKAPSFEAVTTQGKINFPSDYAGKWIILFSHPADFTPVCTSEFMTFGKMSKEFEDLNCQLVGLSVDGLYSHIAWLRTIKDKIDYKGMKNIEIKFPLIEDITMNVAKLYGMIQPGESSTSAVRAVFFIDPQGTIRTIMYYPLSLGRNFDEIKESLSVCRQRIILASLFLQTGVREMMLLFLLRDRVVSRKNGWRTKMKIFIVMIGFSVQKNFRKRVLKVS